MDVEQAIKERRAYRSLEPVKITEDLVKDLAESIQLAPSCYNNQPWRFVFVYEDEMLKKMHTALTPGNKWAQHASMIVAVFSRIDYDCQLRGRDYFLFDTGIATAYLVLRATELGLVAHPIAGYSEEVVKEVLNIPEDMKVITLVIFGKHTKEIADYLSENQAELERKRPERLPLGDFAYLNKYGSGVTGR
ncbi:MAG: nitroreductase family protein [Candidatus Hodarchaeota archaeon]